VFALQAATIALPVFAATTTHDGKGPNVPPSQALTSCELWDWEPLRQACQERHLTNPALRYLGNGSSYCIPQISYPWVRRNEPATVAFLWRYEEGPIDWEVIRTKLAEADVALTALNYEGLAADKQPWDNAHNGELATLLKDDSRFEGPIEIDVGARPPARIVAFFRMRQEPAPQQASQLTSRTRHQSPQ
jgi:hypothetical protein